MLFEINFGAEAGNVIKFKSRDDLLNYLSLQYSYWGKLSTSVPTQNSNFSSHIVNPWQNLVSLANQLGFPENVANFQYEVNRLNSANQLISRESPVGKRISEIVESLQNATAGWGALQVHMGGGISSNSAQEFKGAVMFTLLNHPLKHNPLAISTSSLKDTQKMYSDSYLNYVGELESKNTKFDQNLSEQIEKFHLFMENSVTTFNEKVTVIDNFTSESNEKFEEIKNNLVEDWGAITKAYREQMKLKAPSEYWSKKSDEHKKKYDKLKFFPLIIGVSGLIFLAVILTLTWFGIHNLFNDLLPEEKFAPTFETMKEVLKYQVAITGFVGLVCITFLIWFVRYIVRLMLTEHHLHIDAQSREIMTQTYLALIEDKAEVDEKDRAIILAALFRPVTDGLVKDDGMPLTSPAAFIADKLTK